MTKNQSFLFRLLLFICGACVILFVFFLNKGGRELSSTDTFVWISIAAMYLIFFLPFFFSLINTQNFSNKIPSLSLVWVGIIIYVLVSVIIIVLLSVVNLISLNTAIAIQAILFFIFLINVYFAYFASSHVGNVAQREAKLQQYITQIKSKSNVLLLSVKSLPSVYENPQKILIQSIDDIKYIYPVNNDAGSELELKILNSLNTLSQISADILSGADNSSFNKEVINLQTLVNERKLLRN